MRKFINILRTISLICIFVPITYYLEDSFIRYFMMALTGFAIILLGIIIIIPERQSY